MAGAADIPAFRSMRTLRALRPLRAVSRWEGMRVSNRNKMTKKTLFALAGRMRYCALLDQLDRVVVQLVLVGGLFSNSFKSEKENVH